MSQQSSGNDMVERVRTWLGRTWHSVLYGPEVGPERARHAQPGAVEPEPGEAAREERGRRDAGVAEDAQQLEGGAADRTSLVGQSGDSGRVGADPTASGAAVVTSVEDGGGEETGMSGRQHDLASAEPGRDTGSAATPVDAGDESAASAGVPDNQHDVDSPEPVMDTTRASEPPAEGAIRADAETGSTWAPVHGDTSYDEMTREPLESAAGQPASVVPDVGGVTGTAGATNLDDSAGAPAENTGLDDMTSQVSDLRDRPPSETDFSDEPANAFSAEDEDAPAWSGTEETAADLQFGSANEQIGFGSFDSRPEEAEEAGAVVVDAGEGDVPEEFGVADGVTEIVPDSDDEALVGDVERDVNADETGGGANIAAAAVIDADAGEDAPRGAVRGDGSETCPPGYPVKGNASSHVYHVPDASSYDATKATFCFATEDDAIAAGYRAPIGR